jgi:hypothetical protein
MNSKLEGEALYRAYDVAKKELTLHDVEGITEARSPVIAATHVLSYNDPLKAIALISITREIVGATIIAYLQGMAATNALSEVEIELLNAYSKTEKSKYLELVKKVLEYGPEILNPSMFATSE